MAIILLSSEATGGDTFNTHLQGLNRMTLTPVSGQAVDFALKVSSWPVLTSLSLCLAEFNYLSPIRSFSTRVWTVFAAVMPGCLLRHCFWKSGAIICCPPEPGTGGSYCYGCWLCQANNSV